MHALHLAPSRWRDRRILVRSHDSGGLGHAHTGENEGAADQLGGGEMLTEHRPCHPGRDDWLDHADGADAGGRQMPEGGGDQQV
jgi:hypothetical protein